MSTNNLSVNSASHNRGCNEKIFEFSLWNTRNECVFRTDERSEFDAFLDELLHGGAPGCFVMVKDTFHKYATSYYFPVLNLEEIDLYVDMCVSTHCGACES